MGKYSKYYTIMYAIAFMIFVLGGLGIIVYEWKVNHIYDTHFIILFLGLFCIITSPYIKFEKKDSE